MSSIEKLLEIMAELRDPATGCPWDRQQDFSTIAPYTVEEAYEVADAIARKDLDGLRDELGDLLFQVAFYARMAEEQGAFDFEDVAIGICDKMVRRHPHVFGTAEERAKSIAILLLHDMSSLYGEHYCDYFNNVYYHWNSECVRPDFDCN